jgi:protein involved in polysaccharide export with SLBB domain
MKKLILIIILLPTFFFGQNIDQLQGKKLNDLSDTELLSYWEKAQENGYSLDQIKILARAQGISEIEITEFEKRIGKITEKIGKDDGKMEFDSSSLTSIFGKNTDEEKNVMMNPIAQAKLPIFGSNYFNNENINSSPILNVATPSSYELGPGDEILISIWGAAENEYSSLISREGFVKVERIGPVYLSGLTITEAKNKLKRSLSKIYSGINSSQNSEFKVYLDLSLLNTRSIVVNVTGNVVAPDTYTVSSLSTVLNVLYSAGGPNDSGSYRNIKVIRNGKNIKTIDLYDYFSKGIYESFSLRDQDVILVPNYQKRIFVNGEFKNKGIFEVKDGEKLSDLIKYSGGISSFGVKEKLFIKRNDGLFRQAEDVKKSKFSDYNLFDGDIIEARSVTDIFTNLITIEGAISTPGDYSLNNIKNVEELISEAGGLTDYAITERAYLIRKEKGVENSVISFNLFESKNIELRPNDRIIISSNIDMTRSKTVTIEGEVFDPKSYPFFDGMKVADLILMSKGITKNGDLSNIDIYRSTYDEDRSDPIETIKVSLNSDLSNLSDMNNKELKEDDLVVVRGKLGFQEKEFVTVEGLVKYPGTYAIKNNNYSFFDLIQDFKGFLNDASLDGVKIIRENKLDELINEEEEEEEGEEEEESAELFGLSDSDSLKIKVEIKPFIEFGVDVNNILATNGTNPKYNVILKSSDKIIVPRKDNTIEITGAVQQSSAVTYSSSLTTISAINRAGGFSENASRRNVYVVYQNGNVASTKSFFIFNNYPKLKPGAKIVVPEKNIVRNKTSVGEIVGYTTSLVSIIALIKSL